LLLEASDQDAFVHSLDGSWFVGNMIVDARSMLDPAVRQPLGASA
jgi:hypothetical protein